MQMFNGVDMGLEGHPVRENFVTNRTPLFVKVLEVLNPMLVHQVSLETDLCLEGSITSCTLVTTVEEMS